MGILRSSTRRSCAAATEWLRDNVYEPEHLRLCWGDSRLSNILYGPQFEVAAVVDWEIAYIGDHEADLAWLLVTDWATVGVPGHAAARRQRRAAKKPSSATSS